MSARHRAPLVFDDGYLSLDELATYSGLSVRQLRKLLHAPSHPLPHFRVGKRVLVKRSEYDAWAQQFHQTGEAPEAALAREILDSMKR
jgi:excisionase family DNA binding protein